MIVATFPRLVLAKYALLDNQGGLNLVGIAITFQAKVDFVIFQWSNYFELLLIK